jgi:hypothetical protein
MADTNLSVLQRLRSMANLTNASPLQADLATGADTYAPTEGELLRQQLTPGQGSFGGPTTDNPNMTGVTLSRDMLREAGLADFKRRLMALNTQYVAPEQIKGQTELTKQQLANSGNYATEQLKGEAAARTAAVPRTVNQNITTNAGAGAQGSSYAEDLGQRALEQVNKILPMVNNWSAGAGSTLSILPMSSARALKSELEALKSDIGFKALNEMRAASKTGGALGQVSDIEERLLSQSLGGLDQANTPQMLQQQLKNIAAGLTRWENAKRQNAGGEGTFQPGLGYSVNINGDTGGGVDPYGLFGGQ